MFQTAWSPSLESHEEQPSQHEDGPMTCSSHQNDGHHDNVQHVVRHMLDRHGPELLRTYNDPQVDFMQVLAREIDHMPRRADRESETYRHV